MPRPRTLSDAAILEATGRVVERLGPTRLTLADVAAEVGLAAPTLVQRFGSKRGLLLAFAEQASASVSDGFAAARAATRSPLGALLAALERMASPVQTPEAMANNLAFLQTDLADPEFHRHALAHARAVRTEIRALLEAAVRAGELAPRDGARLERLARAVQVVYTGALVTWAVEREGTVGQWLRDQMELLLAPHRNTSRRSARASHVRPAAQHGAPP